MTTTQTFLEPTVVAYFSMEIGLNPDWPTYSGGLGVLAGDTLKSAADLGIPLMGITLIHRRGYFRQQLDQEGNQQELPADWAPEKFLELLPHRLTVPLADRQVNLQVWRYQLTGSSGRTVSIYFLDAALPDNQDWDRTLTDYLYGGDSYYRLCQEVLLGYGGITLLESLGLVEQAIFHLNEGHSSLLALALLERLCGEREPTEAEIEAVRQRCVFTTHTPVPAGHDQFSWEMTRQVLGERRTRLLEVSQCCINGQLNMTYLALRFARYINGVAMRHGEISVSMFPEYPIDAITNGVHAVTWTSPPLAALYDRRIPEWRTDNFYLRYAIGIPLAEIEAAHREAKQQLLVEVQNRTGRTLALEPLTLGFARRATAYKRPDLLFTDLERLRRLARDLGPLQIIYAGKAHPRDEGGKEMIRRVFAAAQALAPSVPVVYLEDYDMNLGKLLCAGVDLWLNTPLRPQEASGTSGMKAALNGVPSLSILDGWWLEGHVEQVTGWAIGNDGYHEDPAAEAKSLYDKLEQIILPLYYQQPREYTRVRRSAIAINGSFFNTQRMVAQYLLNAYRLGQPRNA